MKRQPAIETFDFDSRESDILAYAGWLTTAKAVRGKEAISASSFMLQEGLRTGLYAEYGLCRVYIEPWSQNNFAAMRCGSYKYYWCAKTDMFFVEQILCGRKTTCPAFGEEKKTPPWREFSGAKTRENYELLISRCVCLKDSLGKLYSRLPESALI